MLFYFLSLQQVKIKSVKQFFGPVVTTAEEEDESRAMSTDDVAMTSARGDTRAADRLPTIAGAGDSEDIPLISFRLKGNVTTHSTFDLLLHSRTAHAHHSSPRDHVTV